MTAKVGWKWSFTDLPKYADGKEIVYSIKEDTVDGYTPSYTDFNITNTYSPEQTSVSVMKAWDDKNDQDGIRPESITVKLLADGKDTKETAVLSDSNKWTHTFTGLDKFKGGKEIVYTVEEAKVEGYETSVTGNASTGFVITNCHTPAPPEKPEDPDTPGRPDDPDTSHTPETPVYPGEQVQPPVPAQPIVQPSQETGPVQTGDSADPTLWIVLLTISGTALLSCVVLNRDKRRRKRRKEGK